MSRVLVVAPHPDDEVLGVGGTIAKLAAQGDEVAVAIVTKAGPPVFTPEVAETGRQEAAAAHEVLGVKDTRFLPFPAAGLDTVPHRDVNAGLLELFVDLRPEVVFLPFGGDLHRDHREVFEAGLVCSRPSAGHTPMAVYAYETLSETNWNAPYLSPGFAPNVFVDISAQVEIKIEAMRCYASQLRPSPHERSLEALMALARLRGATIGAEAAEAFVLVREIR